MTTVPRRPAGSSTGGQFAPTHRPEAAGVTLPPRPRLGGVEIPDGWSPAPNRLRHDDFVVTRTAGNLTASLWKIAHRDGYQFQVVDTDFYTVGEDRDYWFDDLDEAVAAAERDLRLHP